MTDQAPRFRRDYDGAMADLRARLSEVAPTREARMQLVADLLWERFGEVGDGRSGEGSDRGVSWVGFYLPVHNDTGEPVELILGPRRDRPACSPIGLHGACGRTFLSRTILVITDVANLGDNYVACDPRDRAELVIPCLDEAGDCFAVLDFDSFQPHAFNERDAAAAFYLLVAAELTAGGREGPRPAVELI